MDFSRKGRERTPQSRLEVGDLAAHLLPSPPAYLLSCVVA